MKAKKLFFLAIACFAFCSVQMQAQITPTSGIVYVKESGSGNGSSWESPCDLAEAMLAAQTNTNIQQIWVANGTYYPKYRADDNTLAPTDRNVSFVLPANVKIYGSFPGNASTAANSTLASRGEISMGSILSGDIDQDGSENIDNNCFHVVIASSNVGEARLDGFTIQDGNAYNPGDHYGAKTLLVNGRHINVNKGGGMFCTGASPTLYRIFFWNNSAGIHNGIVDPDNGCGGGMYNYYASPTMDYIKFIDNRAGRGGAMYNEYQTPRLTNAIISRCQAYRKGAGIYNDSSSPYLTNVTITYNTNGFSEYQSSLYSSDPGGPGMYNSVGSTPKIYNTVIYGNYKYDYYANAQMGNDVFNESGVTPDYKYSLIGNIALSGNGNLDGTKYSAFDDIFVASSPEEGQPIVNSPIIDKGSDALYSLVGNLNNDKTFYHTDRKLGESIDMGYLEDEKYCPPTIDVIVDLESDDTPIMGSITVVPDSKGIVYVKDYDNDNTANSTAGNGSSWEAAHSSLADVLVFAYYYPDCIEEIWVAEGTYHPEYAYFNEPVKRPLPQVLFMMVGGVDIYGGFPANATTGANSDKDDITMRNWDTWKSILSGDTGESGVVTDNANTVVASGLLSAPTELNGFVITGGYGGYEGCGGGIFIVADKDTQCNSLYVKNVVITGNHAGDGGGVWINQSANPVFVNVLIAENTATYRGGGVFKQEIPPTSPALKSAATLRSVVSSCDETMFTNVTIAGNSAENYGGICLRSGLFALSNTIVWGNTATSGSVDGLGGGGSVYLNFSIVQDASDTPTTIGGVYVENYMNLSSEDPEFAGKSNGNLDIYEKYRLSLASTAAINKGNNVAYYYSIGYDDESENLTGESDLAGEPRIFNATIDLGAYEAKICLGSATISGSDGDIVVSVSPNEENNIVYVKAGGAGDGDGSSWEDAHASLADVLAYAYLNPDCIDEIWVAEGTYIPEYSIDENGLITNSPGNSKNSFVMVGGIDIYGGFPADATTEDNNDKDNISHRNWNKWETLLSGNLGSGNAEIVVGASRLSAPTELNGFVITEASGGYNGGGLYIDDADGNQCNSLYVKNTVITGNQAYNGGGVWINRFANPIFVNVLIAENTASNLGGGIFKEGAPLSSPSLKSTATLRSAVSSCDIWASALINVTIAGNTAGNCGGIYWGTNTFFLYNSIVWGNTATNEEGDMTGGIGGRTSGMVHLSNSIVQDVPENPTYIGNVRVGNSENLSSENPNLVAYGKNAYRLTENSTAAINKGVNPFYYYFIGIDIFGEYDDPVDEKDLAAISRIIDNTIDIGAFEFDSDACPLLPAPDENGIMYVDHTKNGNGESWECALTEVADALLAAQKLNEGLTGDNRVVKQIWVAKGTYYPLYDLENKSKVGRYATFGIHTPVELYGGFRGADGVEDFTGETSIDERTDIHETNETILSGDIDNTPDDISGNAYNVVFSGINIIGETVIDGFTISGGNSDGGYEYLTRGAGIFVYHENSGNNMTIRDNIIKNNEALSRGAGIFTEIYNGAIVSIENNTIESNRIYSPAEKKNYNNNGAGIYSSAFGSEEDENITSTINITNNTIQNNVIESLWNNSNGSGGGIWSRAEANGEIIIENNIIDNNEIQGASSCGAGIYCEVIDEFGAEKGTIAINYNRVENNKIQSVHSFTIAGGGGIYAKNLSYFNKSGSILLSYNQVNKNEIIATGEGCNNMMIFGAGVLIESSSMDKPTSPALRSSSDIDIVNPNRGIYFVNNLVAGNKATGCGAVGAGVTAGLHNKYETTYPWIQIVNNTVTGNVTIDTNEELEDNKSLAGVLVFTNNYGQQVVSNNLFWGNTSSTPTLGVEANDLFVTVDGHQNSTVANNYLGTYDFEINESLSGTVNNVANKTGNDALNPLFADATNSNVSLNDYRLQSGSGALDMGDNSLYRAAGGHLGDPDDTMDEDLGALNRLDGAAIDAGAYERRAGVPIDIIVFLQGPTISKSLMTNNIQLGGEGFEDVPSLPQNNPYGVKVGSETNDPLVSYEDINNVNGAAGTVTDWVKVEVRKASDPRQILETKALLLKPNGKVVDIDGSTPYFKTQSESVYLMVSHRNHLNVMSKAFENLSGTITYDFSSGLTQAYKYDEGDVNPMVYYLNTWCMWAGDVDQDEFVDSTDDGIVTTATRIGAWGVYTRADLNFDGFQDSTDDGRMRTNSRIGPYSPIVYY